MPGARLTNNESSMLAKWKARNGGRYPTLRSITIAPGENPVGLRGISDLNVEFGFPVSVLVGANGSGKTTLLSLAALGYNGDGHIPHGRARAGYTFVEFFVRTHEEATPLDIHITWKYSTGDDVKIHRKTTNKWMRYERRAKRPVHFIGVSRIADPSESSNHRRTFA
jgi:predicted ATP-dependent endonuclease of OLD family